MSRENIAAAILRWARVAPAPDAPLGTTDSVRIFRAGTNHYYMKLLGWGLTQVGAAIGLLFSIGFVTSLDAGTRVILAMPRPAATAALSARPPASARPAVPVQAAPPVTPVSPAPVPSSIGPDAPSPPPASAAPDAARGRNRRSRAGIERIVNRLATSNYFSVFVNYILPLLIFLEYVGIATYVVLFVATYFIARLEYEQHWYIVTDRSLRIRTGVLSLSESTMSFANIQQVEVRQGPIQSLLGLADVRVQSAGGGSNEHTGHDPLHTGVFHNVENASEIRDLILARLRVFREAGLGDPGEAFQQAAKQRAARPTASLRPAIEAAREVVAEARALRTALDGGFAPSPPERASQ